MILLDDSSEEYYLAKEEGNNLYLTRISYDSVHNKFQIDVSSLNTDNSLSFIK